MQKGYELRFSNGEIVYWCCYKQGMCYICYGMVDTQFSDGVVIDLLYWKHCLTINDIPLKEWNPDNRVYKLPKEWNYKTNLIQYGSTTNWSENDYKFLSEYAKNFDIINSENILDAYNKGYLVKVADNNHSYIEAEIGKGTWSLVKRYDSTIGYNPHYYGINTVTIVSPRVYKTFTEALSEKQIFDTESKRIRNLSDLEWSIEQIDKVLDQWAYQYNISDKQKQVYRDFIMKLPDLVDVKIKLHLGNIQWKYWGKTKWQNIEVSNWFLK